MKMSIVCYVIDGKTMQGRKKQKRHEKEDRREKGKQLGTEKKIEKLKKGSTIEGMVRRKPEELK